jgi:hypothetical protein
LIDTQEHIDDKTIAITIQGGKLSGKILAKTFLKLLDKMKHQKAPVGKQSIRKLTHQGAKLQNVEINDGNIKCFERTARKYGVDFALKKDVSAEKPKYIIFFKANDNDVMTAAFLEFSNRMLKRSKEKPSIMQKLNQFRELAKNVSAPVKHRDKGGHEL